MKGQIFRFCFVLSALGLIVFAGCMVGPKYKRPETTAEAADSFVRVKQHSQDVNDLAGIDRWWERFADPVTVHLVIQVLENNYDLKAAAARVLQAQAALAQSRGPLWPDVSYSINWDRSKRSFNFGGLGGGRFSFISTTWTQGISVVYVLDLWGRLRRSERAAWADMLSAEASEQVLINSMIAMAVNARTNIATLQKQLEIARANTASREKTLEIVERRYSNGLVGPVDVRLARENLEAAKAVEPSIEMSLATSYHALDVLLGHQPGTSQPLPRTLGDLPDLEPVPVGVPAALLDRRPDVMAAEFSLRAANERIGASIAELFPNLTLTGSLGRNADRWEDVWHRYSETYSGIISLAQPIFRGGQIRAGIKASKARYQELAANYASIVLTAMREVEDALVSEQMLQQQLEHTECQFKEALAAEELSRQRYQRGVEGILSVLESERRRRMAEEQAAILKGQLWTTRVNLFLALGGDWDYQDQEKTVTKWPEEKQNKDES